MNFGSLIPSFFLLFSFFLDFSFLLFLFDWIFLLTISKMVFFGIASLND